MTTSAALLARRALVTVLLALAALYSVALTLTRDSCDAEVSAAYKKVVRKVHPDKRGSTADAQRLQAAKEKWSSAQRQAGRPKEAAGTCDRLPR